MPRRLRSPLCLTELEDRTTPTIKFDGGTVTISEISGVSISYSNAPFLFDGEIITEWHYEVFGAPVYSNSSNEYATNGDAIIIVGTGGDDGFYVGPGVITTLTIDGGGGTDRVTYSEDTNMNLSDGSLAGLSTFSLTSIELASLLGGSSGNTISAAAFTGDVVIDGDGGNDMLTGGSGNSWIDGGEGDDLINAADSTRADIDGGAGSDTIYGSEFDDILAGGSEADHVDGKGGRDFIYGGDGDDDLIGGDGIDLIEGHGGNDLINAGPGGTTDDAFQHIAGQEGNDTLIGGMGRDYFTPGEGTDIVDGVGQLPDNSYPDMPGRGDEDVLFLEQTGAGTVVAEANSMIGPGINVTFTNVGKINVDGSDGNDVLQMKGPWPYSVMHNGYGGDTDRVEFEAALNVKIGSGYTPILHAPQGKPFYYYTVGTDSQTEEVVVKGSGSTRFDVSEFSNPKHEIRIEGLPDGDDRLYYYVDEGNATITDSAVTFTKKQIENLPATNIRSIEIEGGFGPNKFDASAYTGKAILTGNGGNDTLLGGKGNDTLKGGEGNDIIKAGEGFDDLDGGKGNNYLDVGKDKVQDRIFADGDVNFKLTNTLLMVGTGRNTLVNISGPDTALLRGGESRNLFEIGDFRGGSVGVDGGNDPDRVEIRGKTHHLVGLYSPVLNTGVRVGRTVATEIGSEVQVSNTVEEIELIGDRGKNTIIIELPDTPPPGIHISVDGGGGTDTFGYAMLPNLSNTLKQNEFNQSDWLFPIELTSIEDATFAMEENGFLTIDNWRGTLRVNGEFTETDNVEIKTDTDLTIDSTTNPTNLGPTITRRGGGRYMLQKVGDLRLNGSAGLNRFTFVEKVGQDPFGVSLTGNGGADEVRYSIKGATGDTSYTLSSAYLASSARSQTISLVDEFPIIRLTGTTANDQFNLDDPDTKVFVSGLGGTNTIVATSGASSGQTFKVTTKSMTWDETTVDLSQAKSKIEIKGSSSSDQFDIGQARGLTLKIDGRDGNDTLIAKGVRSPTLAKDNLSSGLKELAKFESIEQADLAGTSSADTFDIYQFAGQVTVTGGSSADRLNIDFLFSGLGTINATLSNNLFNTSTLQVVLLQISNASIQGDSGNDTLDASAFTGRVTLIGGSGDDVLIGGSGIDFLYGAGDNDTLDGRGSIDILDGGTGTDTVIDPSGLDVKKNIP